MVSPPYVTGISAAHMLGRGCGPEVAGFFRGFASAGFRGVFVATAVGWSATFVSFVFIQYYLAVCAGRWEPLGTAPLLAVFGCLRSVTDGSIFDLPRC